MKEAQKARGFPLIVVEPRVTMLAQNAHIHLPITPGSDGVVGSNNLSLITGNIGKPGGTSLSITGQCNAMGTCEWSSCSGLPNYRYLEDAEHRAAAADIFQDMARLSKGRLADISGMDHELIEQHRGIQWPYTAEQRARGEVPSKGGKRPYTEDGRFSHADGKARLIAPCHSSTTMKCRMPSSRSG